MMVENVKVNVNYAEEQELQSIPGIGPVLAQRIVQARPYTTQDDITRVSGINTKLLERLKPFLALSSNDHDINLPAEQASESLATQENDEFIDAEDIYSVDTSSEQTESTPVVEEPLIEEDTHIESTAAILEPVETTQEEQAVEMPEHIADDFVDVEDIYQGEVMLELPPALPEEPEEQPQIQVEPPAESAVSPAAVPEKSPAFVSRSLFIWISVGILILAMVFGMALSLGVLTGINGGLRYASPEQVAALSRDLDALNTRAAAMQETLTSMQGRLDNLEALSGRIDTLETVTGGLQGDIDILSSDIDTLDQSLSLLEEQTAAIQIELDAVSEQATRFQGVMDGLRDLLNNLFPSE
jgi:outer membrane murein-binding lipoprotein Lpp